MRCAALVAPLLAALWLLPGLAGADEPEVEDGRLSATLTGASEIPPGDEDGSGTASITVDLEGTELCFRLAVEGLEHATAAHIHDGVEGEVGPPIVTLAPPGVDGVAEGCAHLSKELLEKLLEQPDGYYVNVHDTEHPEGALRGQLRR